VSNASTPPAGTCPLTGSAPPTDTKARWPRTSPVTNPLTPQPPRGSQAGQSGCTSADFWRVSMSRRPIQIARGGKRLPSNGVPFVRVVINSGAAPTDRLQASKARVSAPTRSRRATRPIESDVCIANPSEADARTETLQLIARALKNPWRAVIPVEKPGRRDSGNISSRSETVNGSRAYRTRDSARQCRRMATHQFARTQQLQTVTKQPRRESRRHRGFTRC
jgi:hypothetical protein